MTTAGCLAQPAIFSKGSAARENWEKVLSAFQALSAPVRFARVAGSGIKSRKGDASHAAKYPPVPDNRPPSGIIRHLGREERGRLHAQPDSIRSRMGWCSSSRLPTAEDPGGNFSPARQEPAASDASRLATIEHQGGRMTPAGWAEGKTYPHVVHIVSTGSFAAGGSSGKRLGMNLGRKGCTGSAGRELPQLEPGLPITREYMHVGPAPTVPNGSRPS